HAVAFTGKPYFNEKQRNAITNVVRKAGSPFVSRKTAHGRCSEELNRSRGIAREPRMAMPAHHTSGLRLCRRLAVTTKNQYVFLAALRLHRTNKPLVAVTVDD